MSKQAILYAYTAAYAMITGSAIWLFGPFGLMGAGLALFVLLWFVKEE